MKNKKVKLFVLTAIIVYTAIMIYFMFFWRRGTHSQHLYNLVPFKSIHEYFETYIRYVKDTSDIPHYIYIFNLNLAFREFAVNIFGNIGMFIPYGILLALLFNGRFIKPLAIFGIGILTIETVQLISRRGVFDIDDIILNTAGFLLGYAIIKIIYKFIQKKNREDKQSDKI